MKIEIKTQEQARKYFLKSGIIYNRITKQHLDLLNRIIDEKLSKNDNFGIKRCKKNKSTYVNDHLMQFDLCVDNPLYSKIKAISFNTDGVLIFFKWTNKEINKLFLDAFVLWVDVISIIQKTIKD